MISNRSTEQETFDYVIVGAGSAGCVLANRLSADPRNRVLVLEAGGKDSYPWIHIPVGYLYCMGNPKVDWCFQTETQPGLDGRALNYPRGKVLGGCSSINGMIYTRGQKRDYDHWRQLGNVGWGADDVLPFFKCAEDFADGAVGGHGTGGEVRVESQRLHWDILDAIRDAAVQKGIPERDDCTSSDEEAAGYFRVTQKKGLRWSAADAFLKPALRRPNLKVQTHAHTSRILFKDQRVVGVEFVQDGVTQIVRADSEVILAAGAIGSPHLLEASGIGDSKRLTDIGIPVIHHAPGVGENLQDHLQLRCVYKVSGISTLNERVQSVIGKAAIGLEYLLFRTGPMSMAPSQLVLFARSSPSVETPDIQFHVQPLSLDRFGKPLHTFPAFTIAPCNLRPRSRGATHATSADTRIAPKIDPKYLSDTEDQRLAVEALHLTRRIAAQPALAKYQPEEHQPGEALTDTEDLVRAAGVIGTTIFHPVGTARMGRDEMSVVDERLRVHGINGLRVIDASIMPTITSGNTNTPTMMVAEKGASMIIEDANN
jgi:choline dehydrogenase-like flavoprotein